MNINFRKIFIIAVIAICIIAINLAVFFQITKKDDSKEKKQEVIIDTALLTESFDKIFDNQIDYQGNNINIAKLEQTKELVYTSYTNQEEVEDKYTLNVNIPSLNIDNVDAEDINKEINNIFYDKAINILAQTNKYTVYNVRYKAYVNDNILSLVICATLKEGENPQREIVKTYNYNLSSNSKLTIKEILSYRELASESVQNKIYETIKSASENANKYSELGYTKYLRDVNDSIYKIENTNVFFIGENKAVYILYPYGNSNYTSEIDLLVI